MLVSDSDSEVVVEAERQTTVALVEGVLVESGAEQWRKRKFICF